MISSINAGQHLYPHVPFIDPAQRRQLMAEVRTHGPDTVFENRANRADLLRQAGDEEFAQRAEWEAGFVLDVFA